MSYDQEETAIFGQHRVGPAHVDGHAKRVPGVP